MTEVQRLMLKKRLRVLMGGFGLVIVLIAAKTADLQLVQHEKLKDDYERVSNKNMTVPAKRGNIYDRNGEKLAISVDVPSIWANPMEIADPRPPHVVTGSLIAIPVVAASRASCFAS